MATELDKDAFRANRMFSLYADETTYTDDVLDAGYATGKLYIEDSGCTFDDDQLSWVFMLMLAHILYIQDQVLKGNNSVVVSSGTESKVTVSLVEPPAEGMFSLWLRVSPYGRQILALLVAASAGGFTVGGLPERSAFRKVGGVL
jgi:hypothetical protein